jgi:hypothetical protein
MTNPSFIPRAAVRTTARATIVLAALVAAGCAALPAARMALPRSLAVAPQETLRGLGGGREGSFNLPGASGRFERSATRLSWFDLVERHRATARYTLRWADGRENEARCKGRETGVAVGVIAGRAQPFELVCDWPGSALTLQLADRGFVGAGAGTRSERRGRLRGAGVELELQSVHRVEGSPLTLDAPIGYVVRQGGVPVGAIELNGGSPHLWRPPAGDALHEPVTLALLALALVWDPAS